MTTEKGQTGPVGSMAGSFPIFMPTENKYDIRAINFARQKEPHFLSRSRDGKIIMRRGEDGSMMLFAHDQETIVEMSAEDARDFALWILLANARDEP